MAKRTFILIGEPIIAPKIEGHESIPVYSANILDETNESKILDFLKNINLLDKIKNKGVKEIVIKPNFMTYIHPVKLQVF